MFNYIHQHIYIYITYIFVYQGSYKNRFSGSKDRPLSIEINTVAEDVTDPDSNKDTVIRDDMYFIHTVIVEYVKVGISLEVNVYTYICTFIYIHACIHKYIHTYIHT